MSRTLADVDATTRWYLERLLEALQARLGGRLVSLVLYGGGLLR